jgi:hypothetical protein
MELVSVDVYACPLCELPCGLDAIGPHGLVVHDCEWVLSLVGKLSSQEGPPKSHRDRLLERLVASVESKPDLSPKDTAALLAAAAQMKGEETGGAGVSQALRDWLSQDVPEDELDDDAVAP